jgi:polysaccharide biosynthesis protein PslL
LSKDFMQPVTAGEPIAAVGWPWSADLLPLTTGLVIVGHALRERLGEVEPRSWLTVLVLAAFVLFHAIGQQTLQLNERSVGNPVIATIEMATGIYLCLATAVAVTRWLPWLAEVLVQVGRRSLFVLLFHSQIQGWAYLALHDTLPRPLWRELISLLLAILIPLAMWEAVSHNSILRGLLLPRRVLAARSS